MITKYLFWGLVFVTVVPFLIIYTASGEYTLAALAVGLGVLWLVADAKIARPSGTVFFLAFLALALVANLNDAPIPLSLLGLCADLAAWDVSRFRARLVGDTARDTHAIVETYHLRLLAVTVCAGFLIALLPVFFHLTIPFVIVCAVALFALLALRQSMRSLWMEHGRRIFSR